LAARGEDAAPASTTGPYVLTGEQYKESLRDGRHVIAEGDDVEDITRHPAFRRAVENLAGFFDAQDDPNTRDILTFVEPESGERYSTSWLVPRSREDLERRRAALKISTFHTLGVFGRPPDYGSTIAMGYLSLLDKFEAADPRFAANIKAFVDKAAKQNAICADVLAEPQSDRTIPNNLKPGRLRVVEERPDGVVLYGAKAVGSVAAIGHFCTIANLLFKDMDPACNVWCVVPVGADGLTLVARERVTGDAGPKDHPLDAYGDEPDTFFIFDHVFVPWEDVFVYQKPDVLGLYYPVCTLAHWHILARLWYRGEIFAGVAQAVVDALGTEPIPGVRAALAEVFAYAQTLKAFVLAAEREGHVTQSGVFVPSQAMTTPGRLFSIEQYPRVTQIIRDLTGQGMISRFPESTWQREEIAGKLEEFMVGHDVSARDKNRIFSLAWDLTCSSHAMRVALFENVNATPPAWIREEIYRSYDRSEALRFAHDRAGTVTSRPETDGVPERPSTFELIRREAEQARPEQPAAAAQARDRTDGER
jgi:4-hydroxyphenylacetate 3-monooxygenase